MRTNAKALGSGPDPARRPSWLQTFSVAKLRATANPLTGDPWRIGPISRLAITRAVNRLRAGKRTPDVPSRPNVFQTYADPTPKRERRRWHIERIAYLVVHGWDDPIEVDVGVPVLGCYPDWIVADGNHRLAAAIYRGDATIQVGCCGQQSVLNEYHPDPKPK